MSSKNKLQEFCQKEKIDFPSYFTERLDSPAHLPEFKSHVKVFDKEYYGIICSSKRSAELSAASEALKHIEKKIEKDKVIYQGESIAILIDLENQPTAVDELINKINLDKSNINILVFVSGNSHLVDREWNHQKIHNYRIPSVRNDAADTYMIFISGVLCKSNAYSKYIIVSRDHFAKTLEECFVFHQTVAMMECKVENILNSI